LEEEINVQGINWEDAPEGTTHYEPKSSNNISYFWNKLEEDVWYYYKHETWVEYTRYEKANTDFESFVPKPETPTEDSYTTPEADPFSEALKKKQSEEAILALYLAAVNSKIEGAITFTSEVITIPDYQGGHTHYGVPTYDSFVESCTKLQEALTVKGWKLDLSEEATSQPKSTRASWYDYDKEELIGLPERGEKVYSVGTNRNVTFLKVTGGESLLVECSDYGLRFSSKDNTKPLDYKESPTYIKRKEQHKQLEQLLDEKLTGPTIKANAIQLYNRGWRVSKEEDV
jgi:hypothetical protein